MGNHWKSIEVAPDNRENNHQWHNPVMEKCVIDRASLQLTLNIEASEANSKNNLNQFPGIDIWIHIS